MVMFRPSVRSQVEMSHAKCLVQLFRPCPRVGQCPFTQLNGDLSRTSPNGSARPTSKILLTPPSAVTAWNRRRRRSWNVRRRRSARVDRMRSTRRSNSDSRSAAWFVSRVASRTDSLLTDIARLEHRSDASVERTSDETNVLGANDLPVLGRLPDCTDACLVAITTNMMAG